MRAVAEWRVFRFLALAPPDGLSLQHLVFHGLQAGAFVGAVAKRWMAGSSAGAPPVNSGLDFERQWFEIANDRIGRHAAILKKFPLQREMESVGEADFM